MVTINVSGVPVGGCSSAHLLGTGQAPAVEENWEVHNVPHVVVTVDVGVSQNAVQVLVDGFDDDVWVTGKDGDEGPFGEQHPYLQDNQ